MVKARCHRRKTPHYLLNFSHGFVPLIYMVQFSLSSRFSSSSYPTDYLNTNGNERSSHLSEEGSVKTCSREREQMKEDVVMCSAMS